ncbi:hypothetical protein MPLDJ20_20217 [Mesorhizobium plurifarium]|uniref:Uncharacterized protein n=1 Tax=Mesorhizobium plurifarium TaxID=69974 RepID=A0A090EV37_MESPL|nr:hypothetical protein MPLDJ20_20217 [Mesorhizobium plurifarium]
MIRDAHSLTSRQSLDVPLGEWSQRFSFVRSLAWIQQSGTGAKGASGAPKLPFTDGYADLPIG